MIVKWVHRFAHPATGEYRYYRDTVPHMTTRLSEATIHDMKYFAPEILGYELAAITMKELFAARLANK